MACKTTETMKATKTTQTATNDGLSAGLAEITETAGSRGANHRFPRNGLRNTRKILCPQNAKFAPQKVSWKDFAQLLHACLNRTLPLSRATLTASPGLFHGALPIAPLRGLFFGTSA